MGKKIEVQRGLADAAETLEYDLEDVEADIAYAEKEIKFKNVAIIGFALVILVVLVSRIIIPV